MTDTMTITATENESYKLYEVLLSIANHQTMASSYPDDYSTKEYNNHIQNMKEILHHHPDVLVKNVNIRRFPMLNQEADEQMILDNEDEEPVTSTSSSSSSSFSWSMLKRFFFRESCPLHWVAYLNLEDIIPLFIEYFPLQHSELGDDENNNNEETEKGTETKEKLASPTPSSPRHENKEQQQNNNQTPPLTQYEQKCQAAMIIRDGRGCTPLHYVNNSTVAKLMINLLPFRDLTKETNYAQGLPLHSCCEYGHESILDVLLEKNSQALTAEDKNHFIPLHWATINGHMSIVTKLVNHNPDTVSCRSFHRYLPHHCAAMNGHYDILEYLMKQYPQGVWTATYDGSLPVHLAIRHGHIRIIRMLIQAFPDALVHRDVTSWIPLFHALNTHSYYEEHRSEGEGLFQFLVQEGNKLSNVSHDDVGFLFQRVPHDDDNLTAIEVYMSKLVQLDDTVHDACDAWRKAWQIFGRAIQDTPILHAAITAKFSEKLLLNLRLAFDVELVKKDSRGRTALIVAIQQASLDESMEASIRVALHKDLIKHWGSSVDTNISSIGNTNQQNDDENPAMIVDEHTDRLPLQVAAELGLPWSNAFRDIVNANMRALDIEDPVSGLFPCMLAGVGSGTSDLTAIYKLFLAKPDVLEGTGSSNGRDRDGMILDDDRDCKRRKLK